jgi:hypothetical protein
MSGRRNKLQKVVNSGRSAGPNLLPGGIVANGREKDMNADEDDQASKGEQANSHEKDINDFRVATGECQHSGLSLSVTGTLAKHHQQRLRQGRKAHPKVRKIVGFRATFRCPQERKSVGRVRPQPWGTRLRHEIRPRGDLGRIGRLWRTLSPGCAGTNCYRVWVGLVTNLRCDLHYQGETHRRLGFYRDPFDRVRRGTRQHRTGPTHTWH